MTTALYSFWAGSRTAHAATGGFSWVFLALFVAFGGLWGSVIRHVIWHAIKTDRGSERAEQRLPLLSPGSWGEPDLAPPSQSCKALAEVAELEALWRQPRRRRRASSD
jgi:hypothetical protein